MNILGITHGHDAAACVFKDNELVAFCKQERLDRIKNSRGSFDLDCITEVLDIARFRPSDIDAVGLGLGPIPARFYRSAGFKLRHALNTLKRRNKDYSLYAETRKSGLKPEALIDLDLLRKSFGWNDKCRIFFANHHYSHVLGAFRYSDWEANALFFTCDGVGDGVHHSAYLLENGKLHCLFGGEGSTQNDAGSMGMMYGISTQLMGFMRNRHEGKVTGLAAYGKPAVASALGENYRVSASGIETDFKNLGELRSCLAELCAKTSRENFAASVQTILEQVIVDLLAILVKKHNVKYLGLNGGVFANVKLNQRICHIEGVQEIFVFPPMSDEGLSIGNAVFAQQSLYGLGNIPRNRFDSLYLGRNHPESEFERLIEKHKLKVTRPASTAKEAATMIHRGLIGAIYTNGMEMGPRALGARSIIASPVDNRINDSLNKRLDRSEFMPFAPVVRAEDAQTVFRLPDSALYAAKFMTVTTDVNPEFSKAIAAAVHVDGTARPQTITREQNALYYDTITEFKSVSDIPCLINTSFNAHEEPIINTPDEAVNALVNNRIDFLFTENMIIMKQTGAPVL